MKTKKNFAGKLIQINDNYWNAGRDTGLQYAIDMFQMVLSDPRVMGKDTFGPKRMQKVCAAVQERVYRHYNALDCRCAEADVEQERIDNNIKRLWGDKFNPFYERYPWLKQVRYGGKNGKTDESPL